MKKYYIKTYGCQMNEHDSRKMEALLLQDGYEKSRSAADADLIVLNTCSIREKAYHKAVSKIGQLGKVGRPGRMPKDQIVDPGKKPIVAITGCVVSHSGESIMKRFPHVDMVLGPDHIDSLPELARRSGENRERFARVDFTDISDYEFPSPILTDRRQVKAYVTIMKGCDNTCSFCIVPFTRGAEVSRASGDVIDEINRLSDQGVREVMLLGQNVNSYGKNLSEKTTFARLLRRIDQETSIDRLRFTSPHPKDLSLELIEEYGRNTKLCPHMHMPVQAGSNRVLKRMRRSYTRATYLRRVEALRAVVPDVAITTDVIVGFPGETEEDFGETLALVREVGYDMSYSFAYSQRPGTEAAGFADDVPPEAKKDRLARLQSLQEEVSLAKNRERIGMTEDVLVEGMSLEGSHEGLRQMTGHTPHGRIVNFVNSGTKSAANSAINIDGGPDLTGAILKLQITEASAYSLKGKLCS